MFKKYYINGLLGLLIILSSLSNAKAYNLDSFQSVQNAVNNGEDLTFVVNYSSCSSEPYNNSAIDMVGSFKPSEILKIKK